MTPPLEPKLSVLDSPQRRLWDELVQVPEPFVLYGGTAIALRLGHRNSVDFDLFAIQDIDPDALLRTIPFLIDSRVVQKSPNTLTCVVDRQGPVKVSFFGVPNICQVAKPAVAVGHSLKIASLIDLAGMKAGVIQNRAEAKDYIDLNAIRSIGRIDLSTALAAAATIHGNHFNPIISLKALCYFEEGDLGQLDERIRADLLAAVKSVDLDRLPSVSEMDA